MESYLISDNHDTLVGMKMAGVSGEIIKDPQSIIEKIDALIDDPKVGIIVVTTEIKKKVEAAIIERKNMHTTTLFVEIPGPKDKISKDFITRYIRESIGLKL